MFNTGIPNVRPLKDTKSNEDKLSQVSYKLRGFGKRHWRMLHEFMISKKYEKNFINQIKVSFAKFKAMYTIDPLNKQNIIWIFKHFLTLNGQKLYSEFYDSILEVGYDMSLSYVKRTGGYDEKVFRLMNYFKRTDPQEWIPLRCFPTILFEKKRMDLAFVPLEGNYDLKEVRNTFFNYIYELDLKTLFIPPPDILYKVGNQLYNDGGVARKDYERPTSGYRAGFKYQYFLAQPLSPREVWLPDKFTKHNNLFLMTVCRQLLKKDATYPSPHIEETYERVRGKLFECIRFDVSGFGFQFPRVFLELMASVIQELYPCTDLDNQVADFIDILNSVKVECGFEVFFPPRGIGLGYYEDLKTLCMLALLKEFNPLSVYGDQGLMQSPTGLYAIPHLVQHDFIIKFDKVEFSSHLDGMVKWAGHSLSNTRLIKVKEISNALIGSLFCPTHWERKNSLFSFFEENKIFYKNNYKKLITIYNLIFGYEFYEDDLKNHFQEGGINPYGKLSIGETKLHVISKFMRPYEDTFFEAPYITPFKKRESKKYPLKENYNFQRQRQRSYSKAKNMPSEVMYYFNPRLEYNNVYKPHDRVIPDWADYLYMVNHGMSTGNFTYGLDIEKINDIASRYTFSPDPLRAAARGGYKILDLYHSSFFPLGREWTMVLEYLKTIQKRDLTYVNRNDLPQNVMLFEDPLYHNTNLFEYMVNKASVSKRKRSMISATSDDIMRSGIVKRLKESNSQNIGKGIIDTLSKTVTLTETVLNRFTEPDDYVNDYEDMDNMFIEGVDDLSTFEEN
jgi:hypothetical protein